MTDCSVCGRHLRSSRSIARGMGPTCAKKSGSFFSSRLINSSNNFNLNSGSKFAKVIKPVLTGGILTGNPYLVPIYGAYSTFKFGEEIYNSVNKSNNKKTFSDLVSNSLKKEGSNFVKNIATNSATDVAKRLRHTVESSGAIDKLSKGTGVDAKIYSVMFENTVKDAILSGLGAITEYAIDEVIK